MEDRLLIWKLKRGNRDALRQIYDKYRSDLLRVASGLLIETAQAEDAVHDVFIAYKSGGFAGIRLSNIPKPAHTITLGEKRADSDGDAYMDIWPPQYGSDHLTEVAHGKHRIGSEERNGGSNYAFADGSVRYLKFGEAFSPKNLWAVTDQFRNAPLPEL